MNFEEGSYFSDVGKKIPKKIQIFGKDFSVKCQKQKLKKNKKTFFFQKKSAFLIFFNSYFFMESRQIGRKTRQRYQNNVCYVIFKCVKVIPIII